MKTSSLKEMIETTSKCFICQKEYNLYWEFWIGYDSKNITFKGIGYYTNRLNLKDGKLSNKESWKFDVETGKVESDANLFNAVLSAFKEPSLKKKCKSCDVSIWSKPIYNHIENYPSMPPLMLGTSIAKFSLSPNLRAVVNQTDSTAKLSLYDNSGKDAFHRTMINPIDFSSKETFKNLKNKIKMILAFM